MFMSEVTLRDRVTGYGAIYTYECKTWHGLKVWLDFRAKETGMQVIKVQIWYRSMGTADLHTEIIEPKELKSSEGIMTVWESSVKMDSKSKAKFRRFEVFNELQDAMKALGKRMRE